ncbi:MAG: outer membrane beta-barrel protein, partial [Bacteroidaceae bacterium]
KDETFDIYNLRYPSQPQQASQYLNTFINNKPDRTFGYSLSPLIALIPSSSFNISLKLTFGQNNRTHTYSRYNLEKLDEWGEDNEHVIGELPSETDYKLHTFDRLNSFDFYETDKYYGCEITYYYQSSSINAKEKIKKNKPFFVVSFPVMFHHKRLNYERGEWYFGKVHRNTTLLSPYIQYKLKRNNSEEYSFEYHVKQKSPSMTSLLDIENTSDPLNIYCGNRELKNSTEHDVFFLYAIRNKKKETMFTVKTRYVTTVNALAYIYNVDRTTGVNTYTPDNVNGNYNLSTTFWYDCPLDKKHKLTLSGSTVLRLDHGVDYITEDLKEDPLRSTVNTWSGTEKVELKYKFGKHSLGTKGYMKLNRVTSTRKDFRSINLCDFHYGLTSLISLPWQLQVSTDLTMYCRRGYNDSGVNTNDLVWNARLSKTFAKAGLTLMVDGFDILGNLSNVSQVLNSQGRTETWRNSLPRYVMFHAIYRFNKQPKKK